MSTSRRFTVAYGTDRGSDNVVPRRSRSTLRFQIRWRDRPSRLPGRLVVAAGGVEALLRPGAEVT
jgi:hypothetical protein